MKNTRTTNRAGAGASGRERKSDRKPVSRSRRDAKPAERDRRDDRERRDAKPFDRERKPYDRERKPFDGEKRPYNRERKPFDGERKPFDRERKPFDGEKRPYNRERKPFDGEKRPYNRERKPFDGERKPYDRERKPFDGERKPYSRDRKPFDGEKPVEKERKIYRADSAPVYFDENSFKSDRKPVIRERRSKKSSEGAGSSLIRLNKFIANSGICSRREADEYIQAGLVTVNGEIVTELGVKITQNDDIRFNGERLRGEEKVYIVMNKPKDFVTTMSDPNAEKTVMDLVEGKCPQRVFPVGRLDKMTTGVLLLTNDGDLAEKLTHPSNMQRKIYHVYLDKNLSKPDFDAILEGITLEDGAVNADALSYVDGDESQVGIEIHSGRNRIVRRIFEHLDYKIKKLDRVYFAGLTKKNLRRGQWRFLTEQEAAMLKMGAYE